MNKIIAFFAALKLRLTDRFAPTIGDLLETLNKIETQIENAIVKGHRELEAIASQAEALSRARSEKNSALDRAYKLLNNVAGLGR